MIMHRISMRIKWNLYNVHKAQSLSHKDTQCSWPTFIPCPKLFHTITLVSKSHIPALDHGSTRGKRFPLQFANQHHYLHPQTHCPIWKKWDPLAFHLPPDIHPGEPSWVLASQVTVTHSMRPDGGGTTSEHVCHHLLTLIPQSTCPWVGLPPKLSLYLLTITKTRWLFPSGCHLPLRNVIFVWQAPFR